MTLDRIATAFPLIAFVLIFLVQSLKPLFVQNRFLWKHDLRHAVLFLFNSLVLAFALGSLNIRVLESSAETPYSILNRLQLGHIPAAILSMVLFDLWMYWWHRLLHVIPFLWRFHRMHHSDPTMNVTTAFRFHTGELILSAVIRWGVFYVIGMTLGTLLMYETLMMPVVFLQHSNWCFPSRIDRVYRLVFASPWMHWVHHSEHQPETNSNYGTILSCWDRLFHSYRINQRPLSIRYGLSEFRKEEWQTLWGLFRTPL
jgi:sterol desaturase/sphingolipid hydroxylase (fatty acid hydroxylase superfamily)